jgi:U2 small nuclear ribonucleoprotein A'
MVRLTAELIEDSFQYMNPIREYELCLRGYKIGLIENLGTTLNQFDTIDFTDNDIRRLDNFPVLSKIKSLLLSNNKIQNVALNLERFLPHLDNLILTNNNVEDLNEIDQISTIKTLKTLSLLRNPIASLKHYRLYTIFKMPNLRILDFKKIKQKEREDAHSLFKGKKLKKSDKPKTFTPGERINQGFIQSNQHNFSNNQFQQQTQRQQPSKSDIDAIRFAISQAKSIDEIERLNAMLRSGVIPTNFQAQMQQGKKVKTNNGNQIVEEDDDDNYNQYNSMQQ